MLLQNEQMEQKKKKSFLTLTFIKEFTQRKGLV